MSGRGNRSIRRKSAPVPLSTTDRTWPDLGTNPGRRGQKLVKNRLNYSTTFGIPCSNIIRRLWTTRHWLNITTISCLFYTVHYHKRG
jgi:hypothetical protein